MKVKCNSKEFELPTGSSAKELAEKDEPSRASPSFGGFYQRKIL